MNILDLDQQLNSMIVRGNGAQGPRRVDARTPGAGKEHQEIRRPRARYTMSSQASTPRGTRAWIRLVKSPMQASRDQRAADNSLGSDNATRPARRAASSFRSDTPCACQTTVPFLSNSATSGSAQYLPTSMPTLVMAADSSPVAQGFTRAGGNPAWCRARNGARCGSSLSSSVE